MVMTTSATTQETAPARKAPVLKCETVVLRKVDYNDMDRFIREATGKNAEIVAMQEWGNNESHEFDLDGKVDEYDMKKVQAFLAGKNPSYCLRAILNYLVREEFLLPGTYLIEVSW